MELAILLRTIVVLGEGGSYCRHVGMHESTASHSEDGRKEKRDLASLLAEKEQLFWQGIQRRVSGMQMCRNPAIDPGDRVTIGRNAGSIADTSADEEHIGCDTRCIPGIVDVGGGVDAGRPGHGGARNEVLSGATSAAVISELSELLAVFRLLASRSLLSRGSEAALEDVVFPAVLSRRR